MQLRIEAYSREGITLPSDMVVLVCDALTCSPILVFERICPMSQIRVDAIL